MMPRDWNAEDRMHAEKVAETLERVRRLKPEGFSSGTPDATLDDFYEALDQHDKAKDDRDAFFAERQADEARVNGSGLMGA
jgi:hypothetical protein